MTRELVDNAAAGRFELHTEEGLIASAEYAVNGDTVAITRVFTRPTHRGQGLAADITEFAVDSIAASGRKVVPVCSYALAWYEHHPERADTLAS